MTLEWHKALTVRDVTHHSIGVSGHYEALPQVIDSDALLTCTLLHFSEVVFETFIRVSEQSCSLDLRLGRRLRPIMLSKDAQRIELFKIYLVVLLGLMTLLEAPHE